MWCALCGAEVDKLCSLVQEGQDRLLNLTLQQLGRAFVIALDNSFDGQLKQDEEQNYLSSKLDFKSRGVGWTVFVAVWKNMPVLLIWKFKLKISPVQLSCPCPAKKTEPTLKVDSEKQKELSRNNLESS